ncbi:unnamed protein product [Fusarium graminearum]|uniref:Uncharacterized protein n=1 Tax=Gibberella zeae TaxID=5518 RepID=A0A4E9EB35_GIBZA|nr:unnamed protein product [Fusarium graminearum]CAF3534218.1 unnamed protein product [Fusarium graminearum]CAG1990926.1 unnamed protein product [Fusarium graminearum]CAG2007211.1 unnamed protein product [Fusarium graminearum]
MESPLSSKTTSEVSRPVVGHWAIEGFGTLSRNIYQADRSYALAVRLPIVSPTRGQRHLNECMGILEHQRESSQVTNIIGMNEW